MPQPRISLSVLKSEKVSLNNGKHDKKPDVQLGELVFGVARIFASFNDTFVHVTDLRFVTTIYEERKLVG